MRDAGGTLTFDGLEVRTALPAGLPRFVPLMEGSDIGELDRVARWPAYAVRLRLVFSAATHRLSPAFVERGAHRAMGLRPGQLAVLAGYGEDPLVEAWWTRRRMDRLVEGIAAQGWDLVLSPNYSMYGNQPRAEHLLNFRRNLMVASELAAAGVAVAPNVYWFRREDLDRTLRWCSETAPAAVGLNLQTFRSDEDWEVMALPGLTYLSLGIPVQTRVIVNGSSRADRIAVLRELFGERLVLMSQNAVQGALHGKCITERGWVVRHAQKADLFAANVRFYDRLVHGG